jgi:hypothetical protein
MAYHKIDADSVNSITNALDFFHIPPTNVSVSSAKVFEILPSNPLTDTPYHFKIHSSQNFIDLSRCYLFTEFRIRKEDANGVRVNLDENDNVAPIQMIGATFINNIRMTINGREIFNSNSMMPYKSYLSHELSFSPQAKTSHLTAAGYYLNDDYKLEQGKGFENRRLRMLADAPNNKKTSGIGQFITKLDIDICHQPAFLINFTEIDLEILPAESRFLLVAKAPTAPANSPIPTYHLECISCKLYVKKVDVLDSLALEIARKLESAPARYAIRKTMMKSLFITQGRYEFNANICMDQIPRRVTLGLVANSDYVGNIERSPFNFQHFNVREISLIANGRTYPNAPYELDYPKGKYVRAYNDFNEAIGLAHTMDGNGIDILMYSRTHCIYVFNMTNSGEDEAGMFDLIKNGTTSVNIKFSSPVPEGGIMLVCMLEMDSLLMVDKNRVISSDTTI